LPETSSEARDTPEQRVRALPLWRGAITIAPLTGGVSNASFTVTDETGTYVARVGQDYPAHHVFRERELAVTRAAHAAGLSPEVVYSAPGIMVVRHITAKTYTEADVRANAVRCVEIVKRCHRELGKRIIGPGAIFWVFHVLRDYAHTLREAGHRHADDLERWMATAEMLEAAQMPLPIVFGHHDLLPTNFMDDGERLWLIDWEYGAFGTAMFDLANMASNSSFGRTEEQALLETYFGRRPEEALWRSFDAMKTASALRESMWGMISELYLNAPGVDYVAYAAEYLGRFENMLESYRFRYGKS
jgi:thiamine kinase-like enzyme